MKHIDSILAESKRGRVGYGSVYCRGACEDFQESGGIQTVLRGQVWMVQPEISSELDASSQLLKDAPTFRENYDRFDGCADCEYAPNAEAALRHVS